MKEVICIICPRSCHIQLEQQNDAWIVKGNGCSRGAEFAVSEMTNPLRCLTTTVRTVFKECPLLPVKTDKDIPLNRFFDAMRLISQIRLDRKISVGEKIIENILDTDANIVSTGEII